MRIAVIVMRFDEWLQQFSNMDVGTEPRADSESLLLAEGHLDYRSKLPRARAARRILSLNR